MKGIPWSRAQDEALRAGWSNPKLSIEDVADILMVTLYAAKGRARKLKLEFRYDPPKPKLLHVMNGVASILLVGDGGHTLLVDEADVEWVLKYPNGWLAHKESGGLRYVRSRTGFMLFHRLLTNAPEGSAIDHKNRNGLDNRRCNLRLATSAQNNHNSGPRYHAISQYKGVWIHPDNGRYHGRIMGPDGRRYTTGYHSSEIDAARAHDALAFLFRGEFAYLNFPENLMTKEEICAVPALNRTYKIFTSTKRESAA